MPANAPAKLVREDDPYTASEIEYALELSSRDPDAPLPGRMRGALLKAAVHGASIGVEFGGPIGMSDAYPLSALEIGSREA